MKLMALMAVVTPATYALAQNPFQLESKSTKAGAPNVGGKTSMDLVKIEGASMVVPLRNGGIIEGSEFLYLDGRPLKKGTDYSIDYANGTVFLLAPPRPGQAVRASYRFDPEYKPEADRTQQQRGFKFQVAPGATAILSLGMTERGNAGTLYQSNAYGMQNNFSLGGNKGRLKGVFIAGDRQRVQAKSLFEVKESGADEDTGKSQAIIQNFEGKIGGGAVTADYQSVTKNFTAKQTLKDSGFDDAAVNAISKERGMQRLGYNIDKIGLPGLKFSNSMRTINDGKSSIEWRTAGLSLGPLTMEWQAQKVDPDFSRFKDIREADREQLMKEKGLNRETLAAQFAAGAITGNFRQFKVEDKESNALFNRSGSLGILRTEQVKTEKGVEKKNVDALKVQYSDQHIEKGFTRFGDLREGERGQWAREQGARRQAVQIDANPFKNGPSVNLSETTVRTDSGRFNSVDLGLNFNRLQLQHLYRGVDSGFSMLGNLAPGEVQAHIQAISRMYEAAGIPFRGEEVGWFNRSAGIKRFNTRVNYDLGKGFGLEYDNLNIVGAKGSGDIRSFKIGGAKLSFAYRQQRLSDSLDEIGQLMEFERQRLGTIAGLRRTDVAFHAEPGGAKVFDFNQMRADSPNGNAYRTVTSYNDKGIAFSYKRRGVDSGFDTVNQLIDPERDLFAAMRGFDQTDMAFKWTSLRGVTLDAQISDSFNPENEQQRLYHRYQLDWAISKNTQFSYYQLRQKSDDPTHIIAQQDIERMALTHNLGRAGMVSVSDERISYDGDSGGQQDQHKQSLAYQTQLNKTTALRTEHSETRYANGDRETSTSNTISTEITKRAGVSVSDTRIRRDGDRPDETKRNYGFWLDFGKGFRFSYGYARDLNSTAAGYFKSGVSLTAGQVGGIQINQASYEAQRWDTSRNAEVGLVNFGTIKPIQIGPIKNFTFNLGADTVRDREAWQRENQTFVSGAEIGSNRIGFEYRVQNVPGQGRAIDRKFTLTTDPPTPQGQQPKERMLSASINYKIRTLPKDQLLMIRDFQIAFRPLKNLVVTHQMQTNPETPRGDQPLGTITQPTSVNRWKLDWTGSPSTKFGMSWEESINAANKTRSRMGGVNLTLFANNPSPLTLFYGVEQLDNGDKRQTAHRYSLRFDQRPGPNQLLSIYGGNLSWQHNRPEKTTIQNWSVRFEYQVRF